MIIDFHTHAYPDAIASKGVQYIKDFYGMDWTLCGGTVDDLRRSAADAGVTGIVLLSVAVNPNQVVSINNWLAQQVGGGIHGFGAMHAGFKGGAEELERFPELGFKGVKLHPDMQQFNIDDERMFPLYDIMQQLGLTLLVHSGDNRFDYSHPRRLRRVMDEFPLLTAVAAHLGGYSQWEDAREFLGGHERVYYDTSSSLKYIPAEQAVRIIRGHGTDRILFATDYPVTTHADELERLYRLRLNDNEMERILYKNAENLLQLI